MIASWYLFDEVWFLELALWSAYVISPWLAVASEAAPLRPGGRAVALVALTALAVNVYPTVDESSTAAIGLVFLPVYGWIAVGVVVLLDWALYRPSTSPWK